MKQWIAVMATEQVNYISALGIPIKLSPLSKINNRLIYISSLNRSNGQDLLMMILIPLKS